ncbi:MAG: nucleotide exchange factor GrpE, partial [archaeon]|nr:nucleotide exchange factor GrpE [archaeon]
MKDMDEKIKAKKSSNKKELEKLEKPADEYFERLQRLQADFDNYRKRVEKERLETGNYAKEQLVTKLLEVMDNIERTLKAADESDNFEALRTGIELTYRHLKNILEKEGLEEIETEGHRFDPEKHEALMTAESDEHEDNHVAEVLQKGYRF